MGYLHYFTIGTSSFITPLRQPTYIHSYTYKNTIKKFLNTKIIDMQNALMCYQVQVIGS